MSVGHLISIGIGIRLAISLSANVTPGGLSGMFLNSIFKRGLFVLAAFDKVHAIKPYR